jgi:glucan 1,3-beta-glucosidase
MSLSKVIATSSLAALATSKAMIGTNAGGWLVLEPWITPSLFYRFLDKTQEEGVGIDSYSLCDALGPELGNAVMRDHWDNWITETQIKQMADREVEIVRLPIGDWTLKPYGPYTGCMDGAEEKIQWFLNTCEHYGIKVLLDVHALIGSQNGFDNSGKTTPFNWTDDTHYEHWNKSAANWIGDWNGDTNSYDNMNQEHIDWALDNVKRLMNKWGHHPAVAALEPVNEPWWKTPVPWLKDFYRSARDIVHGINPDVKFVFHDSFNFTEDWNDLFEDDDHENVVMDHHYYQAWGWNKIDDINQYCTDYQNEAALAKKIKYDVWIGEWALATDTCAMWLGGFNDANHPTDIYECAMVECPYTYMTDYGVDFDRTAD